MLTLRQRKPGGSWHIRGTVRVGQLQEYVKEHSTGARDRPTAEAYLHRLQAEIAHRLLAPEPLAVARRRRAAPTRVYFLRARDGLVKIGVTSNVTRRKWLLQNAHGGPLEVLGTIPGGRPVESALHAVFAPYRMHGEWFRLPDEIVDSIRNWAKSGHASPQASKDASERYAGDQNTSPIQSVKSVG